MMKKTTMRYPLRPAATLLGLAAISGVIPVAGAYAGQVKPAQSARTPVKPSAVDIHRDISYSYNVFPSSFLDLYLPPVPKGGITSGPPRPAIIFIHGGGWTGGDKKEFSAQAEEMARRGYVAISINYRLAPKYRYPAAVDDVQLAVRWLREHALDFWVDPNRIGAMGASAGGHLAALLAVRDTRDTTLPLSERSSRVQCVVDYFGRMDLTLDPTGTGFTDYRQGFIGKTKDEALALYQEASPIRYVDSRTAPFLIIQGTKDTQVQPPQSERMFAELQRAGVESSMLLIGGQGHGFKGAGAVQAWDAAKSFFDQKLMARPAAAAKSATRRSPASSGALR